MTVPPRRVYLAFEGGGAKGIAHVGALRALQTGEGIELAGFAGTSAGAIVAALAAAGWRADDIVDPPARRTILDHLKAAGADLPGTTAPDLLGARGWRAVSRFRDLAGWPAVLRANWLAAALLMTGVPLALHAAGLAPVTTAAAVLGSALLGIAVAGCAAVRFLRLRGLAGLDTLRDALQAALSLKVHGRADGPAVTFGALARHPGCRPLRIVATELDTGAMRLFPSSPGDLDIPVADAVAASACIPGLFAPVMIGGRRYLDGGLVSNLPAWAFDTELRLEDTSTVFAVEIGADGEGETRGDLARLVRAAIFGRGALNTRGIPQLHKVVLDVRGCGVLDFDLGWDAIARYLDDAAKGATGSLLRPAVVFDRAFTAAAQAAADLTRAQFAATGTPYPAGGRLRAAILEPFGTPLTGLRIRFTHDYEDSADDRMSLPLEGSVSGLAFRARRTVVFPTHALPADLRLDAPEHRILRQRTRREPKRFLAAIPLDLSAVPQLDHARYVIQIDGDADLHPDLTDEAAHQQFAAVGEAIARQLGDEIAAVIADTG